MQSQAGTEKQEGDTEPEESRTRSALREGTRLLWRSRDVGLTIVFSTYL